MLILFAVLTYLGNLHSTASAAEAKCVQILKISNANGLLDSISTTVFECEDSVQVVRASEMIGPEKTVTPMLKKQRTRVIRRLLDAVEALPRLSDRNTKNHNKSGTVIIDESKPQKVVHICSYTACDHKIREIDFILRDLSRK